MSFSGSYSGAASDVPIPLVPDPGQSERQSAVIAKVNEAVTALLGELAAEGDDFVNVSAYGHVHPELGSDTVTITLATPSPPVPSEEPEAGDTPQE